MSQTKIHYFYSARDQATRRRIADDIARSRGTPAQTQFSCDEHDYYLADVNWNAAQSVLSAVVYKLRKDNLPRVISRGGPRDLPLNREDSMGEGMCFVYDAMNGVFAVHYCHNGARAACIPAVMDQFGCPPELAMHPFIRNDFWERLRQSEQIRALSVKVRKPNGVRRADALGVSLSRAIDAGQDLGCETLELTASMGHKPGSLDRGMVGGWIEWLCGRNTGAMDGGELLGLHARVRLNDGIETLDMLKARIEDLVPGRQTNRRLDYAHTIMQMKAKLVERRQEFLQQLNC